MYQTPFQRHRARVQKQQAAEKLRTQTAVEVKAPAATDYAEFEVLKYSMEQDVEEIANIPKGKARDAKKAEMVARYQPHADAYIESGEEYANPVFVQLVIWLLDIRRIGDAIQYAKIAIAQKQANVPQFKKRNLATVVADEIRDWAEEQTKLGHSPEPYFSDVRAMFEEWPVPDVVRMKAAKFAGLQAYDTEDWKTAVTELTAAEGFADTKNPAKVSTKLNNAKKKLAETEQAEKS